MPTATNYLTLSPLIERALHRELARRRSLRPHAQLAIAPDAAPALIESAFAKLRTEYAPSAFSGYGDTAVAAATEICALLATAHERMRSREPTPRPAPTVPGKKSSRTRTWLRALRRALWLGSVARADRGDRAILDDV